MKRDGRAFAITIVLLIIGAVGIAVVGVWVYHEGGSGSAGRRDPSYRYGKQISPYSLSGNSITAVHRSCATKLSARRPFNGFSLDRAIAGCVDNWVAVMR